MPAAVAVADPTWLFNTVVLCAIVPNAVRYFGLIWLYWSNCVCRCSPITPLYPISATMELPAPVGATLTKLLGGVANAVQVVLPPVVSKRYALAGEPVSKANNTVLPPFFMAAIAASVAMGCTVAAAPCVAASTDQLAQKSRSATANFTRAILPARQNDSE